MAASAKNGALGNGDIAADDDALQIQQPAFLAEPDVIANREFPWKSDFDLRLDGDIPPNVRTKRAQHHSFQR